MTPISRDTPRPEVLRGTRRLDANRIVEGTVGAVRALDSTLLDLIDFDELDLALVPEWTASLRVAVARLNRLRRDLEAARARDDA